MKKALVAMCMALSCTSVFAQQQGDKTVGANLLYGTDIKNIGIGVKGQYNVTDPIRVEAAFDYFLKKDGLSMWDINATAHYLFNVAEGINVYPLAGLTYSHWNVGSDAIQVETDQNPYTRGYGDDYDYDFDDNYGDASATLDLGGSSGKIGVNIGGGADYKLTDNIKIGAELKYQIISDHAQLIFGVNATYSF